MRTLTPVLVVDDKDYLLMTPQLAGIAARDLGPPVADLSGPARAMRRRTNAICVCRRFC